MLFAAACDPEPNAQLNDAANYRQPISAKDKVARREGVLSIDPSPFARGASVVATAEFDQPGLAPATGACGGELREYRLRFVALDASGGRVPTIGTVTTAPFVNAAKGARTRISLGPAFVPARASPALLAVASFYQRLCSAGASGGPGKLETTETPVAQARYEYRCGSNTADACAFVAASTP